MFLHFESHMCFSVVIGRQHVLGSVCPARQIKEHQSLCLVESSPLRKRGLRLHAMVLIRVAQVESVSSVIEVSMQPEQKHFSPAVI